MFSEELSILDKNTVMMMIEEQQETIEQQKQEIITAKAGTVKKRRNHRPAEAGTVTAEAGNRASPPRAGESPAEKIKPFSS